VLNRSLRVGLRRRVAHRYRIIRPADRLSASSLSRTRAQARQVACLSNQRQIGIALQLYATENKGSYPVTPNGAIASARKAPRPFTTAPVSAALPVSRASPKSVLLISTCKTPRSAPAPTIRETPSGQCWQCFNVYAPVTSSPGQRMFRRPACHRLPIGPNMSR